MVELNDSLEAELTNSSIQQLLDGEEPSALRARLEASLDAESAARIFLTAISRYSAAKRSDTLHELQHEVYFAKRPSVASNGWAGLNVVILGLLLTAISYYFAAPGPTYTIYVGIIAYGVWLLIAS
jgi:predicted anti-sigma-YlaC factor YlaD